MSAHDTSKLQDLGKRRQRLEAQLAELDARLTPEIQAAAAAGVPQKDVISWTGLSRESVRLKSMSDEEREAVREARRNKKVS
ncbi:hypothetical protein [Actinoplanes sp. NPDC049599]|uniref:hypothetical protein n=1 Tax=Actinoplanes sp. NPDC049599 TaxID=3363903 RepID=UPI0037B8605E